MQYVLTIKRGGFEDRKKPYAYAKSAVDGFDRAVQLHARLAAEITLTQVAVDFLEDSGESHTILRAWDRVNGITIPAPQPATVISTDPVVLYDFTVDGLDRAEVQYVSATFPALVSWDEDEEADLLNIIYVTELIDSEELHEGTAWEVAAELFEVSGLKNEKRPYAILLPNDHDKGGEVSAILVQLIKQHSGRLPVVLTGHSASEYTNEWVLVDLNKTL